MVGRLFGSREWHKADDASPRPAGRAMSTGMVVIMVVAMICATLIVLVKLTSDHPTPKMCAACGHKTADHDGPCKVCYCPGVTTPGSWGLR